MQVYRETKRLQRSTYSVRDCTKIVDSTATPTKTATTVMSTTLGKPPQVKESAQRVGPWLQLYC